MLKAGFARLDITPPFGAPLDGYPYPRAVKGVLDPIELNAIALNDGEKTLVMIAADCEGVDMADVEYVKKLIFERLGLPREQIVISALHQHTSFLLNHRETSRLPAAYAEVLYTKFCDVAQMATDDMRDAEMSTAEKETEEKLGFVRRYMLDDGRVVTNPAPALIPKVVARCAEADNTVRMIRFKRQGANDIALVNFSTHPDVVHGEKVSADWPGFTRRFVESDMSGVSCIFFTGAAGDCNHMDYLGEKKNGYEHSRHMGRVIANAVKAMWDETSPCPDGKIFADVKTVYTRSNLDGEENYEECKAFEAARLEGKTDYSLEQWAYAERVIEIREKLTVYRPINVTAVGIGNVAIIGFSGEPFTEYGAAVREAAGDRFALAFYLTNGHQGYFPSAEAYRQGGYEAVTSRVTPAVWKELIDAAKSLLDKMQ